MYVPYRVRGEGRLRCKKQRKGVAMRWSCRSPQKGLVRIIGALPLEVRHWEHEEGYACYNLMDRLGRWGVGGRFAKQICVVDVAAVVRDSTRGWLQKQHTVVHHSGGHYDVKANLAAENQSRYSSDINKAGLSRS